MAEAVHTATTNRHRLTYIGLWALATVAYVGLAVAGYPAVAAVAFFLFGGATFALGQPASMFDERDADIIEEASANTIQVVGLTSAVVFPSGAPPYVLVILTEGLDDHDESARLGAEITRAVHAALVR